MIYRKKSSDYYTTIGNEPLQCDNLSYKARGILSTLLSRPDDWKVSITQLAKSSPKEGVAAIRTGLTELEAEGFAKLINVRMEDGTLRGMQWFVSDDKLWISNVGGVKGEVLMRETSSGRLEIVEDETSVRLDRHAITPTSVESHTTKERDIQSNDSKSHSLNSSSESEPVNEDPRKETKLYGLIVEVYTWLKEIDQLKGKAKSLSMDEVILGHGKNKGWFDVADKVVRIDMKGDKRAFANLSNAMHWLMFTADDYDEGNNPINGAFWLEIAGWCSMATLRKKSRANQELTQFDQMHASFERWNKKRKR